MERRNIEKSVVAQEYQLRNMRIEAEEENNVDATFLINDNYIEDFSTHGFILQSHQLTFDKSKISQHFERKTGEKKGKNEDIENGLRLQNARASVKEGLTPHNKWDSKGSAKTPPLIDTNVYDDEPGFFEGGTPSTVASTPDASFFTPKKNTSKKGLEKKRPPPINTEVCDDEPGMFEAGTPSTVASTPDASSKIPIKIENEEENNGISSCLLKFKKPIIIFLVIYVLVLTGSGGWILKRIFEIPGLNNEVDELSGEMDRLESTVVDLGKENDELIGLLETLDEQIDRMHTENIILANSNDELSDNIMRLDTVRAKTKEFMGQVEKEVTRYEIVNDGIQEEILLFEQNNRNLDTQIIDLNIDVIELKETKKMLNRTAQKYITENENVHLSIIKVSNVTSTINETIKAYNIIVKRFEDENDRFKRENEKLVKNLPFLNFDISLYTNILTTKFKQNWVIAKEDVYETYLNKLFIFLGNMENKYIIWNKRQAIGSDKIQEVMKYVNDEMLSTVCGEFGDFRLYLNNEVLIQSDESAISIKLLVLGLKEYVTLLLDYYFSDKFENGEIISLKNGAEFCNSLVESEKFTFTNLSMAENDIFNTTSCSLEEYEVCV